MSNSQLFAASGSCKDHLLVIYGSVTGCTFTSSDFTGVMNSQKFWDDLAKFAKVKTSFIELRYFKI